MPISLGEMVGQPRLPWLCSSFLRYWTRISISAVLKKEGLLASLWSSPQTPWKMMGKPWGCRDLGSAGLQLGGSSQPLPWRPPHFFGKLIPGTVEVANIKLVALAGLQLTVVEELIGDPEDGLVGPGRGRTSVQGVAPMLSPGTV